jgi:hypothetical protein
VSIALGRRVAFLGIDGNDHTASARAFLSRFPISYPSYDDPDQGIATAIKAASYFPQTVFIDRRGAIVFDHAGPYESVGTLERDIDRYVLNRS